MRKPVTLGAVAGVVALAATGPAFAEDTLTAVHVFPRTNQYSQSFLRFVSEANKAGKGVFRIFVRGGPEAIKMFEQHRAASRGVVDMVQTPLAFFAGDVPENEALAASNMSPSDIRANGGFKLLDGVLQKRHGLKWLAWTESGVGFHIFLSRAPKFKKDGMPDWTGVKMRGNPIYGPFFKAMGVSAHMLPATQVFSALEKGTVEGAAWTQVGMTDWKWEKFLKFALNPPFYTTDMAILVNAKKWQGYSAKTREILEKVAREHEAWSRNQQRNLIQQERAKYIAAGGKYVTVPAGDKYLKMSVEAAYGRIAERLKRKGEMVPVKELRAKFRK